MATLNDKFLTLYKVSMSLIINGNINMISQSDIVSIAMINNYDTMTYPIIRVRLYSDISLIENLTEYPDDIHIRCNLDGGIYKINDDVKSPVLVNSSSSVSFAMKVYLENKNTPTSVADQYVDGIKKKGNLNESVKVPIELYCYNEKLMHFMKQQSKSIYKNTSVLTVIEDMFRRNGIYDFKIDPIHNQTRYDQILIPNLNIGNALSFFDTKYGLYQKGGQVFGEFDTMRVCNTDVDNGTTSLPIYVNSYKDNTDVSGMKKINKKFYMTTMAQSVSVLSETDVERVLNAPKIESINVNSLDVETVKLNKLFGVPDIDGSSLDHITAPYIIHKNVNKFIANTKAARLNERITRVDVSGTGFDISKMKIDTRYNLIFDSPMRSISMNQFYRATFVSHVLTNLDSNLFSAQTVMNLCSN